MEIIKMKKISIDSARAFLYKKPFYRQNMSVSNGVMRLHGNAIAWSENNKLILSHCGWPTVTTKDRLNAILEILSKGFIFQKNFNWFYKDPAGNITPFNGSIEVEL
jgi:hypothetical protein